MSDGEIAHLRHGVKRAVIFDIDLHHGSYHISKYLYCFYICIGNGTQAIVWQINEETYRKTLESEYSGSEKVPQDTSSLKVYYGSIHDILSYPCEVREISIHYPNYGMVFGSNSLGWQTRPCTSGVSFIARPSWTTHREHSSEAL